MNIENPIVQLQKEIEKSAYSVEELQSLFYKTSKNIINNYILQIDNLRIELKELEFYFFDCEKHPDIYVHQNELQKETSNFLYVHDSWGNYGGLDLTFGNKKYYGGILIRGIKLNTAYIAGPATLRNYIMEHLGKKFNTYSDMQKYFNEIRNKICLIKKNGSSSATEIMHSTRYGLGKKENPIYKNALYRFLDVNYLNTGTQDFFNSKKNINEITRIKTISYLSGVSKDKKLSKDAQKEREKLQSNQVFLNYIEKFKQDFE